MRSCNKPLSCVEESEASESSSAETAVLVVDV